MPLYNEENQTKRKSLMADSENQRFLEAGQAEVKDRLARSSLFNPESFSKDLTDDDYMRLGKERIDKQTTSWGMAIPRAMGTIPLRVGEAAGGVVQRVGESWEKERQEIKDAIGLVQREGAPIPQPEREMPSIEAGKGFSTFLRSLAGRGVKEVGRGVRAIRETVPVKLAKEHIAKSRLAEARIYKEVSPEVAELFKKGDEESLVKASQLLQSEKQFSQKSFAEKVLSKPISEIGEATSKYLRETAEELRPVTEHGTLKYYVSTAIESVGSTMAPALIATLATKKPGIGLSIMFPQVYGQSYSEQRSEGKSVTESTDTALMYAITEVLSEGVPLGIITKQGGKFIPRVLKGATAESIQEVLNEAIQIAYDEGIIGKDTPSEEIGQRLLDAGIIGAMGGAGMGVISHGAVRKETTNEEATTAKKDVMGVITDALKTKEQTPEQALNSIREGHESGLFDRSDLAEVAKQYPNLKQGIDEITKTVANQQSASNVHDIINEGMTEGTIMGEPFTHDQAFEIISTAYADKVITTEDIDLFKEQYPGLSTGLNDIIGKGVGETISQEIQDAERIERETEKDKLEAENRKGKALTAKEKIIEKAKVFEKAPKRPAEVSAEVFEKEITEEERVRARAEIEPDINKFLRRAKPEEISPAEQKDMLQGMTKEKAQDVAIQWDEIWKAGNEVEKQARLKEAEALVRERPDLFNLVHNRLVVEEKPKEPKIEKPKVVEKEFRKMSESDSKHWNLETTDVPLYDNIMKNPEYFETKKGIISKKEVMPPYDYLELAAKVQDANIEEFIATADLDTVQKYADAMKRGEKFPILTLEHDKQNQEGRHRALAAQQIGIEVPVLSIRDKKKDLAPAKPPTPKPPKPTQPEAVEKEIEAKPIPEVALETKKLGFIKTEVLDGREKAAIDPRYIPTTKTVDYIIDKTELDEITVRDTREKKDVPIKEQIKARKDVIKRLKERGWQPWEKDKNIWRESWETETAPKPKKEPKVEAPVEKVPRHEVKYSYSVPEEKYEIYLGKFKDGDKYIVREDMDNSSGWGDPIFNTPELAEQYIKDEIKRDAADKEFRAKQDKIEKEEAAVTQAKKTEHDDIDDFGKNLSPMRLGKILKTLNKLHRFDGGKAMPLKEQIRKLIDEKAEISTAEVDRIKPMSRAAYNRADNQEQEAHDRKVKEGGKKTVYYVGGYDLGKTAYDYAEHLKTKEPKVEAPVEKEPRLKIPEQKPGKAWIKGKQKPIMSAREITKGKNKDKYEITLTRGRDADGNIIPGVKRVVEKKAIITMPEAIPPKEEKVFAVKKAPYVYHGTSEGAFRKIRKEGITGAINYFSGDEQYSKTYAERKGVLKEPRVLRIKKTEDILPDEKVSIKGDFKTKRKIAPEEIEVKIGTKWIPIQEYFDESINIMPIIPKEKVFAAKEKYVGEHEAPDRDYGAPLNDVSNFYPDDIYSTQGARYYGHGGDYKAVDQQTINIMKRFRGKPNAKVVVYRAIPQGIIQDTINAGDWVTINKRYASDHGERQFDKYKIVQKTVIASELFTDGGSIHEWGYDPEISDKKFATKAWQGSPSEGAAKEGYSDKYIGTGEGAALFGYGHYFTSIENIARGYAEMGRTDAEINFYVKKPIAKITWDYLEENPNADLDLDYRPIIEEIEAYFEERKWGGEKGWAEYGGDALDDNLLAIYDKNGNQVEKGTLSDYLDFADYTEKDFIRDKKKKRNLYKVTLHKDKSPNEYAWLDWDKKPPKGQINKIQTLLIEEKSLEFGDKWALQFDIGEKLYKELARIFGSRQKASAFLLRAGIDGIRYPVGSASGVEDVGAKNYVVFDPKAITIEEHIQYATKATKPQDTITRQDLKEIFGKMKNVRTGVTAKGNLYFKVEGRPAVEILEIDSIGGYINTNKGRIPVGSYLKNTIELKTTGVGPTADVTTAFHEFFHYISANGIVTTNDIKALDSAIGKIEVTEEDRATYVGDNLADWKTQTNTRIKRILKKISDFANAIYEFFSRTRTAKGVLRDIETGKILAKKKEALAGINQFAQDVSFSIKEAVKKITDDPNFVKWFGNSKIVDKDGSPLTVYHGTPGEGFTVFKKEFAGTGPFTGHPIAKHGFFFAIDKSNAESYAGKEGVVIPVYIKIKKPYFFDMWKEGMKLSDKRGIAIAEKVDPFIEKLKGKGYDGLILGGKGIAKEYMAFEPTQIKSIYNTGAFGITEPDIMYQMAGQQAIGAPTKALARAQNMLTEGKSKKEVWKETGWLQGAEGEWKFEIDDSGAKLHGLIDTTYKVPLSDILKHPSLYKAYPQLKNIQVTVFAPRTNQEGQGYLDEAGNMFLNVEHLDEAKATIFHEIQHAIQEIEGFARGGSPEQFKSKLSPEFLGEEVDKLADALSLRKIMDSGKTIPEAIVIFKNQFKKDPHRLAKIDARDYDTGEIQRLKNVAYRQLNKTIDSEITAPEQYRHLAGEIEARDTAARAKLTPEQRREQIPYEAEGIPGDQWIITKGEGTSFSVEEGKVFQTKPKRDYRELIKRYAEEKAKKAAEITQTTTKSPTGQKLTDELEKDRTYANKMHEERDEALFNVDRHASALERQVKALTKTGKKRGLIGKALSAEEMKFQEIEARKLAKAMFYYRESQINPEKGKAFERYAVQELKTARGEKKIRLKEQLETYRQSQMLTNDQKKFVDVIINTAFGAVGKKAIDAGIITKTIDNYVRRIIKVPDNWAGSGKYGFKTFTTASMKRKAETIFDHFMEDRELKVSSIVNAYSEIASEVAVITANKNFIKASMDIGVFTTDARKKDYAPLNAQGFSAWTRKAGVKIKTALEEPGFLQIDTHGRKIFFAPPSIKYGATEIETDRVSKYFETIEDAQSWVQEKGIDKYVIEKIQRADVFEKVTLYAPERIAMMLNKMTRTGSGIFEAPLMKGLLRFNAGIKGWILMSSFFHHMAGQRSWSFGVNQEIANGLKSGKIGQSIKNVEKTVDSVSAHKRGLEKIKAGNPSLSLLVKHGLTLGRMQDWDESLMREQGGVTETIARKLGAEKLVKGIEAIRIKRETFTNALFKRYFAGLKSEAAVIEFNLRVKKAIQRGETPNTDSIAEQTARLINADFGGLHLTRMGRSKDMQNMLRLLLLAPDWTESNFRTFTGMVPGVNKIINHLIGDMPGPPGMEKVYRGFWGGVIIKATFATILAQAVASLWDDEEDKDWRKEEFLKNFRRLKWTGVNVSGIYRKMGIELDPNQRKIFSVVGHFADPLKIVHPEKLIKGKGSPLTRIAGAFMTKTDWRERPYTSIGELMTTGKLKKKSRYEFKENFWEAIPSIAADQFINMQPIQVGYMLRYLQGEEDGLSSLLSSAGAHITTAYKPTDKYEFADRRKKIRAKYQRYIDKGEKPEDYTKVRKLIMNYNSDRNKSKERKDIPTIGFDYLERYRKGLD